MGEHLISASPADSSAGSPADSRAVDCAAAIAEIASAMGNTRRLAFVSGGLLAADIAGTPFAVSALLGHGSGVAWGSSALLVPVIVSWLAAAALLLLVEQPTASALGGLRHSTGAPADLSAPWRPLGVLPLADADLEWRHVTPLIGAATAAHARARLALSAAVIATAGFLLWTVLSLAIAAVA